VILSMGKVTVHARLATSEAPKPVKKKVLLSYRKGDTDR